MSKKIVHLIVLDKFIPDYIDFIQKNFNKTEHLYIITANEKGFVLEPRENIIFLNYKNKLKKYTWLIFTITQTLYKAEKIIIHGLWDIGIIYYLFFNPLLLKKCYWVMWGGDFYFPEAQYFVKKSVIKRLGHFVTYIKGDYDLVKKWYGATGQYYECFMYPSNLYKEYDIKIKVKDNLNIQVGNSADPSNNHLEVFKQLIKFKDQNIKIYAPLSYGNSEYAQQIVSLGNSMFGDKFIAMTDFMAFDKYLDFLEDIDIAIFNHNRQQAMGNTITLLGLGKKVYMRNDVTSWKTFEELGIQVFDVENIEISKLEKEIKNNNMQKVKELFSESQLKHQWIKVF